MSKPLILVLQLVALGLIMSGGLPPVEPVKLAVAAALILVSGKAWRDAARR